MMKDKKTVKFHTLGCKVNQYETQALKERFESCGFNVLKDEKSPPVGKSVDESRERADVYVINTCTVTGLSDKKSRQFIRRAKKENPQGIVAVIGCFAQVSPDEAAGIEGVDIVAGTNEKYDLPMLVKGYDDRQCVRVRNTEELTEYEDMGTVMFMDSRVRALIKVQEGCDRFCSYCIIPYARGSVRSRSLKDIVTEAKKLIDEGFKELVITGINTALYSSATGNVRCNEDDGARHGGDISGIEEVVSAIDRLEGDFRIRLGSLEPTVIDADYVKRLLRYEKLCPHMHLSVQSASDSVLSRMNRRYSRDEYMKIISVLQESDSGYGITTDVIAGFPGESDEDFCESLDLINSVAFCKTHVFQYSRRKGTEAAEMQGQIPQRLKAQRSKALIEAAEDSSMRFFKANTGRICRVLVEKVMQEGVGDLPVCDGDGDFDAVLEGHSENYIKVYFKGTGDMQNTFCDVELMDVYRDGMAGRIAVRR